MVARLSPLVEEPVELFQFDKQVFGRTQFRNGAGQHAARITEIRGGIGGSAAAAVVTGLVSSTAARTGATNKTIRQKRAGHGIEELLDGLRFHQPPLANGGPDAVTE